MPSAVNRTGAASATLADGRTLIAGGIDDTGSPTDAVVIYNPDNNSVISAGQLMAARVGATATPLKDGRVLVAGGTVGAVISSDVEVFSPASGISSLIGLLSQPRTGHAAAALADGPVLIAGGTNGTGAALGNVEIVDPTNGQAQPVGFPMISARTSATTLLAVDS